MYVGCDRHVRVWLLYQNCTHCPIDAQLCVKQKSKYRSNSKGDFKMQVFLK